MSPPVLGRLMCGYGWGRSWLFLPDRGLVGGSSISWAGQLGGTGLKCGGAGSSFCGFSCDAEDCWNMLVGPRSRSDCWGLPTGVEVFSPCPFHNKKSSKGPWSQEMRPQTICRVPRSPLLSSLTHQIPFLLSCLSHFCIPWLCLHTNFLNFSLSRIMSPFCQGFTLELHSCGFLFIYQTV